MQRISLRFQLAEETRGLRLLERNEQLMKICLSRVENLSLESFLWNVYPVLWRRSLHSDHRSSGCPAGDNQDTDDVHLRSVHIRPGGGHTFCAVCDTLHILVRVSHDKAFPLERLNGAKDPIRRSRMRNMAEYAAYACRSDR